MSSNSYVVRAGQALQFSASVTGTTDSSVTWNLENSTAARRTANMFHEDFTWEGAPAAVVNGGAGTSVWWNEDDWDIRVGTSSNSTDDRRADGNSIDIRKSTTDLTDGRIVDDTFVIGGDGSPGVGVMSMDFEGIASARLRNPLLISANEPGIVEFMAPSFATTGHWWEVAIAPADEVISGDFTSVPGPGSVEHTFFNNPGPGNAPAEDSINFILMGATDIPCRNGWRTVTGFTRSVNYERTDMRGREIPTSPANRDILSRFRLVYYPNRVELYTDLGAPGFMRHFHTYPVNVPWSEVYVILLGIAYQADHHPQADACFPGEARDLQWKDLTIGPVKYGATGAFPKQDSVDQVARNTGWLGFDLRDTARHGEVNGVDQPNPSRYNKHTTVHICTEAENVYGCNRDVDDTTLNLDLSASEVADIETALFTYDIRRTGGGSLYVNDVLVGELQEADFRAKSREEWIHRSIRVPTSLLRAGENKFYLAYNGDVQLDSLQMEFGYRSTGDSGTILPNGQYIAPERVDSRFQVTVRASSVEDPGLSVAKTIDVIPQIRGAFAYEIGSDGRFESHVLLDGSSGRSVPTDHRLPIAPLRHIYAGIIPGAVAFGRSRRSTASPLGL